MTLQHSNNEKEMILRTIGKVTVEKLESIESKIRDDVATETDRIHIEVLKEIIALASNRISAAKNETEASDGGDTWAERTAESHYPHIRLHGGALEDDPLKMEI